MIMMIMIMIMIIIIIIIIKICSKVCSKLSLLIRIKQYLPIKHSLRHSAYPVHQPYIDKFYILPLCQYRPVLTDTSIPLYDLYWPAFPKTLQ